ncbi:MAG: hypothetical protein M3Q69_03840 [Acidobacteriota bacterium]|nr:hypothetical protein [Acidobacteriota bacterium]
MIHALIFTLAMAGCPMHDQHVGSQHVDERHDTFGMPHEAVHHNFRLLEDGGAIELHANAADDAKTIDAIRSHIREIASDFSRNDFDKPHFVHGRTPDGVKEMQAQREAIAYAYEELADGARVRITTKNEKARDAVHAFLRFQIKDHHTSE